MCDLFAVTFFYLVEALMDEPNAQLDWGWSCTALCRMKAGIITGVDFSAAQRLQVPGGKGQEGLEVLAEVWGVCSLYCLMVPASRCSCLALCVLTGRVDRIRFWHAGVMKGKGRLYKIACLFIELFLNQKVQRTNFGFLQLLKVDRGRLLSCNWAEKMSLLCCKCAGGGSRVS